MHSFEQRLFSNCSTICHTSLLSRLPAHFVKTKPMFYKFILSLELLGKLWVLVMWLSLIKKQADRLISFLAHAQLMPLYKERHHNSSSSFACPTNDTFGGILWKSLYKEQPYNSYHISLAQQITLQFDMRTGAAAGEVVRQPGILKQQYITLLPLPIILPIRMRMTIRLEGRLPCMPLF